MVCVPWDRTLAALGEHACPAQGIGLLSDDGGFIQPFRVTGRIGPCQPATCWAGGRLVIL